jgi:hypothetical protein
MTFDGLTETQRAFLSSRVLAADFEDLSAQDINRMSYTEWAARTGRPSLGEIAAQTVAGNQTPGPPASQPAPGQPVILQAPDVAAMDWQAYAQWRMASGLAARSDEGMSHASLSMADRWRKPDVGPTGRNTYYSGQ